MILGESLWPGMTRHGFAHKTLVSIRSHDKESFPVTEGGRWLPTVAVSQQSFEAAQAQREHFERLVPGFEQTLAAVALESVAFDDTSGCWKVDSSDLDDEAHTNLLWSVAGLDMRGNVLNDPSSKDDIRVCDDPFCMNTRHYDFTHAVKNRHRLLVPPAEYYAEQADGRILPQWEAGEESPFLLPSVQESIDDLRSLQLQCVPYVDDPSHALLSPNAISKITVDERTGCWVTRTYYTRPDDFDKGFMFDGYGRLSFGPARKAAGQPSGPRVAHRVVWDAVGNTLHKGMVLNHECGFRPCCNPKHLTEMTSGDNNDHSRRMNGALRRLLAGENVANQV